MDHAPASAEPRDYRCRGCGKLLFRGVIVDGIVEVKCRHCREVSSVSAWRCGELLCMVPNCPGRVLPPA